MPPTFSVVAIIAAYNEADVIGAVLADLIDQGVQIYFLDDGSTDGTVAAVERYRARGVIGIERLTEPPDGGARGSFDWERILRRKAQLARELDANWFIHHDADEFRESPWRNLSLKDAIHHVDALGYNAIDFAGLDFWPVNDTFHPGDDIRQAFQFYSDFAPYDRVQVRCWKKTSDCVDLASSGGHDVQFPDRKVFPIRFILRHYPIRSQAHGERKVFEERRSRFLERERARGWHVQYDDIHQGSSFLRDPTTLSSYDADALRLSLAMNPRYPEELEDGPRAMRGDMEELRKQSDAQARELERHVSALADMHRRVVAAHAEIESKSAYITALLDTLEQKAAEIGRWRDAVDGLTLRLEELRSSLSWRLTAPARAAARAIASITGR